MTIAFEYLFSPSEFGWTSLSPSEGRGVGIALATPIARSSGRATHTLCLFISLRVPGRLTASGNQSTGEFIHDDPGQDYASDDRELNTLVLRIYQINRITEHHHHGRANHDTN